MPKEKNTKVNTSAAVDRVEVSGIRRMFELAARISDPLDCSLGMPTIAIPDAVKRAAADAIANDKPGYSVTAGFPAGRAAVADKLKVKNKINAAADEVIITHGATGGLTLALFALLNPGDEIIVVDPYFVLYKQMIDFIGATPRFVSSYPDFRLPVAGIEKVLTAKTRAVLINTPHNPTGAVYTRDALAALAEVARTRNVPVISDEVYEDYVYDGIEHCSMATLYPHTVTVMAPSKSAAVAGWRAGYVHAPRDLTEAMLKVQQIFYVCASTLAQKALVSTLTANYAPLVTNFTAKRDMVRAALAEKTAVAGMAGAFYAFFEVGDAAAFTQRMAEQSVLLVPGGIFSQQQTYVRLAYGVSAPVLARALEIIRRMW